MIVENSSSLSSSSEEIILAKLTNLLSSFSYLYNYKCVLKLHQAMSNSTNYFKELKITPSQLNSEFKLMKFNKTFFLIKDASQDENLVSIKSLMTCISSNTSTTNNSDFFLNDMNINSRITSYNNGTSSMLSIIDFFSNHDNQSFIYVIAIFGLFTVIFAFILLLSYHFNHEDAELYESRRYLEKFKLSYDYRASMRKKLPSR